MWSVIRCQWRWFCRASQAVPKPVIPAKPHDLSWDMTNRGARAGIQNGLKPFKQTFTLLGERQYWRVGCLLTLLVFLPVSLLAQESILVKYVIDGDTIILKSGEKVRYIGIDTPEIDHENKREEKLGYAARNSNIKMIGAKGIRLEFDREKHDHFGRRLGYVFSLDNTFINLELLRSGLATYLHKPPNLKYAEKLLQAQRKAMSDGKGVWHAWSERDQAYVGNRKSKRFHLSGCRYGQKTALTNRVAFSRQWDAYWQGYSPCKKCLNKEKAP